MVTSKQRQRQLARAKWERQQGRRTRVARRQRAVTIGVGVIAGLVAAGVLVWLVVHLAGNGDSTTPQPSVPTDSFSTQLLTPSPSGASTPTTAQPSQPSQQTQPTNTATTGGNT